MRTDLFYWESPIWDGLYFFLQEKYLPAFSECEMIEIKKNLNKTIQILLLEDSVRVCSNG